MIGNAVAKMMSDLEDHIIHKRLFQGQDLSTLLIQNIQGKCMVFIDNCKKNKKQNEQNNHVKRKR
jgi:hypothetical protein